MRLSLKLLRHTRFWLIMALLFVDELFFSATNPSSVPSVLLIIGFGLLAITIYQLARLLLLVAGWYGLKLQHHQRRLAGFMTGSVAGLLALQSIGELTNRDILVLLPL